MRPAGNPRSAYCLRLARQNTFGQQSAFHQQNSNSLTTSNSTSRQRACSPDAPSHSGRMPTAEQAGRPGPDGTPPKALNVKFCIGNGHVFLMCRVRRVRQVCRICRACRVRLVRLVCQVKFPILNAYSGILCVGCPFPFCFAPFMPIHRRVSVSSYRHGMGMAWHVTL